MRAVIERAPLLAALSRLMGVVERRQTIAILGNVLISVSAGSIRLRGTDLEMEAIEVVQASVDEPGDVTVSADKLHDIVRNADTGAQITISTKRDDPRLRVQSGRSNFNIPTMDPADFPEFKADGLSAPWSISAKTLADMLSRVAFARGDQSTINAMCGTYLVSAEAELHAVACHKAGLAVRREPLPEGAVIAAVLLPKLTSHLVRWLAETQGDVIVSSSGALIRFLAGDSTLTSKVFDGGYVSYGRVMMEEHKVSAITDQDALSAALKRVMIMGESKTGSVRLAVADGEIALTAKNNAAGDGADEIACEFAGPATDFLMNADMMQAALASLRGDAVSLGFDPVFKTEDVRSGQVVMRAPSDPAMVINLMTMRA